MVEWKRLGEICEIKTGKLNANAQVENGVYPFFTCDMKPSRIDKYAFDGEAILISGNGNVGHVNYYIGKFNAYQRTYVLMNFKTQTGKYLYHCLNSSFKIYIENKLKKGSVPYITLPLLTDFPIPFFSISEQTRIVGILDTFMVSIENLKLQIAERRKQYEHYRDELLDLEGKDDNIVSFGDVCEMIKGDGVQKVDFVDEGIGCIHYGQIYTHYGSFTDTTNKYVSKEVFDKAKKASKGDIIMTDTSENVEDICKSVAYLGEDDIAVSNHALIIKHNQNPKFLSYSTLTRSFFTQKRKYVVGVKVSGIKPNDLAKIKIFLPSIEEQNRIVSILDTFEASIANLEAQLELREKQYEYYRNQLLTFK